MKWRWFDNWRANKAQLEKKEKRFKEEANLFQFLMKPSQKEPHVVLTSQSLVWGDSRAVQRLAQRQRLVLGLRDVVKALRQEHDLEKPTGMSNEIQGTKTHSFLHDTCGLRIQQDYRCNDVGEQLQN